MSERLAHQRILTRLTRRLQFWISSGELQTAPAAIRLNAEHTVSPDIFWVGRHNQRCTLTATGDWEGAPDLVVEIVTPESEADDRGVKYTLYQNHEIFEYWIVNPLAGFIEVFVLMNKRYFRTGLYQLGDSFTSGVLDGQRFEIDDLLGLSPAE